MRHLRARSCQQLNEAEVGLLPEDDLALADSCQNDQKGLHRQNVT